MTPEQKNKRRQWVLLIGVFLIGTMAIILGLYLTDGSGGHRSVGMPGFSIHHQYSMPLDNLHPDQDWVSQGEQRLSQLDDREKRLEQLMNSLSSTSTGHIANTNEGTNTWSTPSALPSPKPVLASLAAANTQESLVPPPSGEGGAAYSGLAPVNTVPHESAKPRLIDEMDMEPAVDSGKESERSDVQPNMAVLNTSGAVQAQPVHTAHNYLPAGSFATVVLLSGFDAPTGGQASQNALPLVMRVKSFMRMPNQFKANIRECFITGSGYGDLASERAYIRTERLSCVLKNGRIFEKKIKGHVLGEDASFGLRGKLVSKQGSLIAKSFVSGLFAGIGNSIAAQSEMIQSSPLGTVSTIDPSRTMQAGMGGGLSTTSNKIADFYLQQANQIFPIIEISALRIGEVFLLEGVDFTTDTEGDAHVAQN